MTRDELQDRAVIRLEKERRLIVQWATGMGKSNVVLKFLKKHPDFKCLIIVPEIDNIDNWLVEFKKFGVPSDNVRIVCYASFRKFAGTKWDLLVFDEMPHVDTEKRLMICNSVSGEYIVALGAMIDDDERASLESVYGVFDKHIVTMPTAIRMGILPNPTIKVLHLQLDDTDRKYLYKGRLYTAKERYSYIERKVKNAKDNFYKATNNYNKNQMFRAGNERKRFLGELKGDAMRRLCDALCLKKRRFLCFCSSIDQANKLGKMLSVLEPLDVNNLRQKRHSHLLTYTWNRHHQLQ